MQRSWQLKVRCLALLSIILCAANIAQADDSQPQLPRNIINPDLLHWNGTVELEAAKTDTQNRWAPSRSSRYSLYDASVSAVTLDLSVGFKPSRIMSLNAAW